MAFTASAIMSDDISRMNVENDVSGISKICRARDSPGGGATGNEVRRNQRAEEHAVRGQDAHMRSSCSECRSTSCDRDDDR